MQTQAVPRAHGGKQEGQAAEGLHGAHDCCSCGQVDIGRRDVPIQPEQTQAVLAARGMPVAGEAEERDNYKGGKGLRLTGWRVTGGEGQVYWAAGQGGR